MRHPVFSTSRSHLENLRLSQLNEVANGTAGFVDPLNVRSAVG